MITVHFHPERATRDGRSVLEALASDGRWRTQFETGTSSGGLTAVPGGDRWRWESRLFDGRYDDGPPSARPAYGGWDRRGDGYGAAPRFGSAYLRLSDHVLGRTTFCYPDSVFEPAEVVGRDGLDGLDGFAALVRAADAAAPDLDPLDDYVEAHVHGGLDLARDVEAVVLDPSFRDGPVGEAAAALPCRVEWHAGFRVLTADLDPAYRTVEAVALARDLGETLTPREVGEAAAAGHDPQVVKHVWHLLARFGRTGQTGQSGQSGQPPVDAT